MFLVILLSFFFGIYAILDHGFTAIGLAIIGNGINLFIIAMAIPGHPLTESIILTAIVISMSVVALWSSYNK